MLRKVFQPSTSSVDAMTTDDRPTRLAIVGGGVIGSAIAYELARRGAGRVGPVR